MRHRIKGRKFSRGTAHRSSMLMNLTKSLIIHQNIVTTLPKAKDLRPVVEKIITLGKNDTLSSRRRAISFFRGDYEVVKKLFSEVSPMFAARNGGYTSIVKAGYRQGDSAPMAIIRFVGINAEAAVVVNE